MRRTNKKKLRVNRGFIQRLFQVPDDSSIYAVIVEYMK